MKLHWQILIALAFAVIVGSLTTSINTIATLKEIKVKKFGIIALIVPSFTFFRVDS